MIVPAACYLAIAAYGWFAHSHGVRQGARSVP